MCNLFQKRFFNIILLFFVFLSFELKAQMPDSDRLQAILKRKLPVLEKDLKEKDFKIGAPVFLRIFKKSKELELWILSDNSTRYKLFKTYSVCTYGSKGLGPKLKTGDEMAPEGFYYVSKDRMNPNSSYHLSFNLGYPNKYDSSFGRTGSALMVHGDCVSVGCYAMTDESIEEIYTIAHKALEHGQKFFRVHCFPFRLTTDNLKRYKDSQWYDFWKNLQEGYLFFENNKVPPDVQVRNKRYVFK
jgi:murein L,D-transpeptidase YafK